MSGDTFADLNKIGDKKIIELNSLGSFTATVHRIVNDRFMLVFDDYVTKYSGSLVKTEIRSFLNESVQGLRNAS